MLCPLSHGLAVSLRPASQEHRLAYRPLFESIRDGNGQSQNAPFKARIFQPLDMPLPHGPRPLPTG